MHHLCPVLLFKHVFQLIKKDLLLEWREKNALSSILLYVLSTTLVVYQIFVTVESFVWIALYWVITLFASINAASRSFTQDEKSLKLYYYQIVSPQAMILSKMVFNVLLLCVLALVSTLIFAMLLGFPVESLDIWLTTALLGGFGLALTFTMISAIASKARNPGVLMTILGLPLIIPQVLVLVKLSKGALLTMSMSNVLKEMAGLVAIDVIVIAVALLFFPYLWKD